MAEPKLEIRIVKDDVFIWECPVCGFVVKSLFKNQVMNNARAHMRRHEELGEYGRI